MITDRKIAQLVSFFSLEEGTKILLQELIIADTFNIRNSFDCSLQLRVEECEDNDNRIFAYLTIFFEEGQVIYSNRLRPFTDKSCKVLVKEGRLVLEKSYFLGTREEVEYV